MADKSQDAESVRSEGVPVDMTGFALLQIIAWNNGMIAGVKTQLESEKSSTVLAHLQGQIPGCKFALQALKEQFQLNDDFMANETVCDYANLSYEEMLGAKKDIANLQTTEPWQQFLQRVDKRISGLKEFLLFTAKKSRDMYISQGRYEGMTAYKEVFKQVEEALSYRKTMEPLFHQDPGEAEAETVPDSDPGTTAIVPAGGRDLVPPGWDDEGEDEDEEDNPDLDIGIPEEGAPE